MALITHTPRASLTSLPRDVKALIVDLLDERDRRDLSTQNGRRQLGALSRVNREWYGLAQPRYWKGIGFSGVETIERVESFAQSITPIIASHVVTCRLGFGTWSGISKELVADDAPRMKAYYRILAILHNVVQLDVEHFPPAQGLSCATLLLDPGIGMNVTRLHLLGRPHLRLDPATVARIIRLRPLLYRLFVWHVKEDTLGHLAGAVEDHSQLRHLGFWDLPGTFAPQLTMPLTRLTLEVGTTSERDNALRLLERANTTLEYLEMRVYDFGDLHVLQLDEIRAACSRPFPRLEVIDINGRFQWSILLLFNDSPLTILQLERINPSESDPTDEDPQTLLTALQVHSSTLKEVLVQGVVENDPFFGPDDEADWTAAENFCDANEIEWRWNWGVWNF